jgi:lysophospholipase L1-like esterase
VVEGTSDAEDYVCNKKGSKQMKRSTVLCVLLAISSIGLCESSTPPPQPWLGIHVMLGSKDATEKLTAAVGELASLGVNALVTEINYGYQFESHPELSGGNASSKADIQKLVAECRKHKVRLIPQFQCLGHQSWSGTTFSLLTKHPEFDETPGKYPQNKGIYCRSWCPLHPEVNAMIFDLMDELLKAFEADAMHVGMDEVFLVGDDDCPRCKGKDKAELFAKAITDYHGHLVGKRKVEMLMWGDRLIDASKISYGEWEASKNGTAGAIDRIPKDIIICDWHYEPRTAYESVPMFVEKGFRVWPGSWKNPKSAHALIDYSKTVASPKMLGHLNTTWGSVQFKDLARFEPLLYSVRSFGKGPGSYLSEVRGLMQQQWPGNRTINIVCHGHSVPSGYFKTPVVDTFNAYPHLLHEALKSQYPYAVINVIVTAIGGENSESGSKRFEADVLALRPDVITIDYGLNDRGMGVDKAKGNLTAMIEKAKAKGIKVLLLTPTGDTSAAMNDPQDPLNQQAEMIRGLAAEQQVGLVDSLKAFGNYVSQGGKLEEIMSQVNHPNRKGHDLVVKGLMEWFGNP